jgi:tetratricopeptide (TPR) repeat protein
MNIIERIATLVGLDMKTAPRPDLVELRNILDEGRQRKRTEMYDEANNQFEQALTLARTMNDKSAVPIVQLHRADVFIRQGRWDEAEALLRQLESDAKAGGDLIQQAYTVTTMGTMYQAQGDLSNARRYYEQGLEIARRGKSAGAEGRSLGHLADTYLLEGNASYAVHLMRDALVKLNSSNDMELSSYFIGRLGEALIATGQEQEGEQMLSRALRLAQHMNYRPFERLWHLALARRAMNLSRYREAFNHYERTLVMLRASAPEVPEVLRELSRVSLHLGRNEEALGYANRALLLQPEDALTQGVMGFVLQTGGDSAEAIPYLQKAIAYSESHTQDERAQDIYVEMLRTLASALADTGDVEGATETFNRALRAARNAGSPLEEARVHRDMGSFHMRQKAYQAAIKSWMDAVSIYDNHGYHSQVARLYCDIANLRMYLGLGQRAMKDYENALMALSSVPDTETRGIVLANAATAYVDQGDIETAEAFFTESIKIAQKLQDPAAEAMRRGNYGWFLLATGRSQRALSALEYAYQQSETLNLLLPMAVQTDNIGLAHGEMGQPELALQYHRRALSMVREQKNDYWTGLIIANMAAQLIRMGEVEEAEPLLKEARVIAERLDHYEINVRSMLGRAKIALLRDDLTTAATLAQDAVLTARRTHTRRLLADSLLLLSEVQAKQHQSESSAASWEEARKLLEILHHPNAKSMPEWLAVSE